MTPLRKMYNFAAAEGNIYEVECSAPETVSSTPAFIVLFQSSIDIKTDLPPNCSWINRNRVSSSLKNSTAIDGGVSIAGTIFSTSPLRLFDSFASPAVSSSGRLESAFVLKGLYWRMSYINIPYVVENNRIERGLIAKELQLIDMSDESRNETLAAIFCLRPRGVDLPVEEHASLLAEMLGRLGIPFRRTDESEYK